MTETEFLESLEDESPPESLSGPLQALWFDKNGDWDQAHRIVQDIPTSDASWVHAYLHREEGDLWNARYWYGRAGRPESKITLEAEWSEILQALLGKD